MTNNKKFDYYLDLAVTTGKNLADEIRKRNSSAIAPRKAADLCVMPVYEKGLVSLLSYTNEIVDTELRYVPVKANYIDAYFMRIANQTGDRPKNIITLTTDSNYCWARFLACKELMHSYFYDTEEVVADAMTSSFSDLEALIEEILLRAQEANTAKPQTYVDYAAYSAAIEYLIPSDTLPLLVAILDAVADLDEGAGYTSVARLIRVPEVLAKARLDDYRGKTGS